MSEPRTSTNSPPQDAPAGFIVPAAILRLLGLFSLVPCIGTLAITASFIQRGPTDRSGVIPAFLMAVVFGFSGFAFFAAARRNSASRRESLPRISPRRVFWFRVFLFPFFAATTIGAVINGWILFRLLNNEYLHWFDLEAVENTVVGRSAAGYTIQSGIAFVVLSAIAVLLCLPLFVASKSRSISVRTDEVSHERLNSNPYAPPVRE